MRFLNSIFSLLRRRSGSGSGSWSASRYQRIRWSLYRIADLIGRPRGVMLAAIVALGAYQLLEQMPRLAALKHERQEMSMLFSSMPGTDIAGVSEEKKRLSSQEEGVAQQFLILDIIKEHKLAIANVSYSQEDVAKVMLQRTVMDLTLTGSYKDFSEMLSVLQKMGGMQIVSVTFERSKIASSKLNIRLQIALLGMAHA
jgi:hypothetical protein